MGGSGQGSIYPIELITEIFRGIKDTADAEDPERSPDLPKDVIAAMNVASSLHDLAPGPVLAAIRNAEPTRPTKAKLTKIRMNDGTIRDLDINTNFKETYRDEYTKQDLPHSHLMDAIHDELSYFNDKVWVGGGGTIGRSTQRSTRETNWCSLGVVQQERQF